MPANPTATTNVTLATASRTTVTALVASPLASSPPTPVQVQVPRAVTLSSGPSAAQIDTVLGASGTLTAGSSVAVNLFDGSALTVAGRAGALAVLRYAEVGVAGATGALVVGGGSHLLGFGTAADTLRVEAGGPHFAAGTPAGWPVTAALATVKITNPTAGPVDWQVLAAGTKPLPLMAFNAAPNSMYVPLLN